MKTMSFLIFSLCLPLFAASKASIDRRVAISTEVFTDRMESKSYIPEKVLSAAECIASVRNVKAGYLIGGEWSSGLVSCRVGSEWSAPSFFGASGAKLGLLIGGQVADNVMVFMSKNARKMLNNTQFTLGTDLSFAVGPVGDGASIVIPTADVLTYTAGTGLYAGFSLDGIVMYHVADPNRTVYGKSITGAQILKMPASTAPAEVTPYTDALDKHAK